MPYCMFHTHHIHVHVHVQIPTVSMNFTNPFPGPYYTGQFSDVQVHRSQVMYTLSPQHVL